MQCAVLCTMHLHRLELEEGFFETLTQPFKQIPEHSMSLCHCLGIMFTVLMYNQDFYFEVTNYVDVVPHIDPGKNYHLY